MSHFCVFLFPGQNSSRIFWSDNNSGLAQDTIFGQHQISKEGHERLECWCYCFFQGFTTSLVVFCSFVSCFLCYWINMHMNHLKKPQSLSWITPADTHSPVFVPRLSSVLMLRLKQSSLFVFVFVVQSIDSAGLWLSITATDAVRKSEGLPEDGLFQFYYIKKNLFMENIEHQPLKVVTKERHGSAADWIRSYARSWTLEKKNIIINYSNIKQKHTKIYKWKIQQPINQSSFNSTSNS